MSQTAVSDVPDQGPWRDGFLAILPVVQTHARICFRHLRAGDREEAIANTTAFAWSSFLSLAQQGRLEVAFPSTLATYAVRATSSGRLFGYGQSSTDALNPLAHRRHGFAMESIGDTESWRKSLAAPRRVCPADQAVFNLDFEAWLKGLNRRLRRIVAMLVAGWRTSEVAIRLRLSEGRISQFRRVLEQSWWRFQGQELNGICNA
jgi:hypothetical protein